MRKLRASAVATVAVLAIAGIAAADNRTFTDPTGDVQGKPQRPFSKASVDFTSAAARHGKKGALKHLYSVRGRVDPNVTASLTINVIGRGTSCDYVVSKFPEGARVMRCSNFTPVAKARISTVDQHTLRYVFRKRAIGSPAAYRWQFMYEAGGDAGVFDMAPDRPKTHKLR
jgi:hypothetical protein